MKILLFLLLFIVKYSLICFSQGLPSVPFSKPNNQIIDNFRIVFYNVENLFDYENDTLVADEEFLPEGSRHWNRFRYEDKLKKIGKTLLAIGEWHPPAIIAFCEIENRRVLEDLLYKTCLRRFGYEIIHFDSKDKRGIDVGLIYLPNIFRPINQCPIPITHPYFKNYLTRDILYVEGEVSNGDTLHLFVNHWPSKRGNSISSDPKRNAVAKVLRAKVDSVRKSNEKNNILIMGDFNETPDGYSISSVLNSEAINKTNHPEELVNLMALEQWKKGTHSFEGRWEMLDQFIVSQSMVDLHNSLKVLDFKAEIFEAEWLFKENAKGEYSTNRTFQGPAYKGGFSDHLPIFLDISLKY